MGLLSLWLGFCGSSSCSITDRLDGRVAVVTGANSGLGLQLTAELAMRGARVIMACRGLEKFELARDYLLSKYGENSKHLSGPSMGQLTSIKQAQLQFEELRLCSFDDVKRFVACISSKESAIDFLVNNAGILLTSANADDELTPDGYNRHFQVNYLSTVLLTLSTLPLLNAEKSSRIVFTTSVLRHLATIQPKDVFRSKTGLLGGHTYSHSKLLISAFSNRLARHLEIRNILVASVDPGIVRTNLGRDAGFIWNLVWNNLLWPLRKDVRLGVQSALHTLLDPNLVTGAEYCDCVVVKCSPQMNNEKLLDAVWTKTIQILSPHFNPSVLQDVEELCRGTEGNLHTN